MVSHAAFAYGFGALGEANHRVACQPKLAASMRSTFVHAAA